MSHLTGVTAASSSRSASVSGDFNPRYSTTLATLKCRQITADETESWHSTIMGKIWLLPDELQHRICAFTNCERLRQVNLTTHCMFQDRPLSTLRSAANGLYHAKLGPQINSKNLNSQPERLRSDLRMLEKELYQFITTRVREIKESVFVTIFGEDWNRLNYATLFIGDHWDINKLHRSPDDERIPRSADSFLAIAFEFDRILELALPPHELIRRLTTEIRLAFIEDKEIKFLKTGKNFIWAIYAAVYRFIPKEDRKKFVRDHLYSSRSDIGFYDKIIGIHAPNFRCFAFLLEKYGFLTRNPSLAITTCTGDVDRDIFRIKGKNDFILDSPECVQESISQTIGMLKVTSTDFPILSEHLQTALFFQREKLRHLTERNVMFEEVEAQGEELNAAISAESPELSDECRQLYQQINELLEIHSADSPIARYLLGLRMASIATADLIIFQTQLANLQRMHSNASANRSQEESQPISQELQTLMNSRRELTQRIDDFTAGIERGSAAEHTQLMMQQRREADQRRLAEVNSRIADFRPAASSDVVWV